MKLSVIIPVYDAEAYLEKCVESVMAFPCEKEVILINDGSRDRSSEICDRIKKGIKELGIYGTTDLRNFASVKVIHQENRGVSAARNVGLDVATGDYVWFVDADDRAIGSVKDDGLSAELMFKRRRMVDYGIETKLVIFGFVWEENGEATSYGASKDEIPYNLWRCWFNRKAIENAKLRFTEGRKYAEDQEFILRFMVNCKLNSGIREIINEPLYYYTLRPGSAMTKKGMKGKMVHDISAVLFGFFFNALRNGMITQRWVWKELKRLTKTLYVAWKR